MIMMMMMMLPFCQPGQPILSIKHIYASDWLCEWKITNTSIHSLLTIMLKHVLRTFQADILKIFKNIQPQPKNYTFF